VAAVTLPPVVALRDTREQAPLEPFVWTRRDGIAVKVPLATRDVSLDAGDYSLPGLERMVSIERKSLADLWGTCFGEGLDSVGERAPNWDRFRAEMSRLSRYARKAILIEGTPVLLLNHAHNRHAEAMEMAKLGRCKPPRRTAEEYCSSIMSMLASVWVDFGVGVEWAVCRKGAERWLGTVLTRIWDQHVGGTKARDARARGLGLEELPWLAEGAEPRSEQRSRFAPAGGYPPTWSGQQRARSVAKRLR